MRVRLGSLTTARRNYLGVRCVPFSAVEITSFRVRCGSRADPGDQFLRVCFHEIAQSNPRFENSPAKTMKFPQRRPSNNLDGRQLSAEAV